MLCCIYQRKYIDSANNKRGLGEGDELGWEGGRENSRRTPDKDKKVQEREEESLGHFVGMENSFTHFLAVPLNSVPALYQEGAGLGEEVEEHWPRSIHCFSVV